MRRYVLLVVAATLLASTEPAAASAQTKAEASSEVQPNDVVIDSKRLLRSNIVTHADDEYTGVKDEERAMINFKEIFNVKKWFRKGTPASINSVTKNNYAANYAANAKNLNDIFSKVNLKKMLKDNNFKMSMFERWNKYRIDELNTKIVQKNLSKKAVTNMFMDYLQNHRPKNLNFNV
ncbi:unnamed protein product [Phytophthora lilii]|uniref:RxLR effector protein n=1 Tax=Phytophthora lilii TaxID=2077276 RepID=A0A9W6U3H9_9STRA|nr:unnamed protein product [Phytophthora lilii]